MEHDNYTHYILCELKKTKNSTAHSLRLSYRASWPYF